MGGALSNDACIAPSALSPWGLVTSECCGARLLTTQAPVLGGVELASESESYDTSSSSKGEACYAVHCCANACKTYHCE